MGDKIVYTERALRSIITILNNRRRAKLYDRYYDIAVSLDDEGRETLLKHYQKKLEELEAKVGVE